MVLVIVLGVALILGMVYNSSVLSDVLPWFSRLTTEEKNAQIVSAGSRLRAPILDRNGQVISDYPDRTEGSKTLTDDDYLILKNPYAFSTLLGYTSTRYGVGGGIIKELNPTLTVGTNSYLNIRNNTGNTVKLTIDSELQEFVYDLTKDNKGAVVVTNSKGEILCLVSTPSYNANEIMAGESELFSDEKYEALFYNNAYEYPRVPGSVFKMISSVAVCESGLSKVPYYDNGVTYTQSGYAIYNSSKITLGTEITLSKAICYSVNTYFADMLNKAGEAKFNEVADRFLIGQEIELDFATLKSAFDISGGNDQLMSSAFGQGKTLLTPLHINMITSGVVTGNMVEPHIVKEVISPGENGKVLSSTKTNILKSGIVSYETASEIRAGMIDAAKYYGMYDIQYNGKKCAIAAKTGTAEISGESNVTNNYITAYFPADNPEYFITMLNVGVGYGSGLASPLQSICNYIAENNDNLA